MIYFVSKQKQDKFIQTSLEDCIEYFKDHEYIAVDTSSYRIEIQSNKS